MFVRIDKFIILILLRKTVFLVVLFISLINMNLLVLGFDRGSG
jgi:hypothetical protein